MTFFTNSKKYAKKIKKAEKCVVYENTVRELFSCEQFKKGAEAKGHQAKIVRIMEQNIGFCRACDGCMRNGGIIDGESSSEFAYCLAWSISIRKETGI